MQSSIEGVKPPYLKLKKLLMERDLKHKDVAEAVGMKPAQFSQKINKNKSNFTLDEALRLSIYLGVEVQEYFFNSNFSNMGNDERGE